MQEIADALGAGRCLVWAKQSAAEFGEQQSHGSMAMGPDDLDQIERGLDQADIEVLGQADQHRAQELDQARVQVACQGAVVL